MASVADCLTVSAELSDVSDTARLDTELLLAAVLGKSRTWLFTWPEYNLSEEEQARFAEFFARRRGGEPVAYILGEREFWSLPFFVDASTLIPRPDTELLVSCVVDLPIPKQRLLDLGTGTGAIALALASELSDALIIAVDKSPEAVHLAQRNQARLGFSNVEILQSDWYSALGDQHFDVIVANPPYIDEKDAHLGRGDVRFEPRSALVAADKGLADIRHIIVHAVEHLSDGGTLLIEHGWQQDERVAEILAGKGFLEIRTFQDLGGNNRATLGRWYE